MGKAPENKVVVLKPLTLARVRCAEEHKDPWLRRLYVLWATPKADTDERAGAFHLGQTDDHGYLTVPHNDVDPDGTSVVPMVEGVRYFFFFVRHPGLDLPKEMLGLLKPEETTASLTWSDGKTYKAQRLAAAMEETGKDKKKRAIKELVIRIPEDPRSFTPVGSELYREWVLFRGMPGTGAGLKDKDIQCTPLKEQVRRLQYHLGALRYWVGDFGMPYAPIPFSKKPPRFANEGVFDVPLWNSTMAFQHDAAAGAARKLDPAKPRQPFVDLSTFDPTAEASVSKTQISESGQYVSKTAADSADALVKGLRYPSVVDRATGDGIKKWLQGSLRKPGPVLVSYQSEGTWMSELLLDSYGKWDRAMKQYGAKRGVYVSNVLRDPRIGVVTGGGMVATSIHKSGFALDLAMQWGQGIIDPAARDHYPLYYERDPSRKDKIRWIVYHAVKEADLPKGLDPVLDGAGGIAGWTSSADPALEYRRSIENFEYDPESSTGGKSSALTIPGQWFLNVTRLAKDAGFARIGPHNTGWFAIPGETVSITDAGSLVGALKRFSRHLKQLKGELRVSKAHPKFKLDGVDLMFQDCATAYAALDAWQTVAARQGGTPAVDVHFPRTKEDQTFLTQLARAAKKAPLKGLAVAVITEEKTEELTLSAVTEFPADKAFTIQPKTAPLEVKLDSKFEFPALVGDPPHLEWWHFQYVAGYAGRSWREILADVGWTGAGLFGKSSESDEGVYGLYGVGYTSKDLDHTEKVTLDS